MLGTRHPGDGDLLQALDGELTSRSRLRIEQHLAACPSCRARMALMASVAREVNETLADEQVPSPRERAAARSRLERALADAARTPVVTWQTRASELMVGAYPALLAATLVLTIGVAWTTGTRTPIGKPAAAARPDDRPVASLTPGAVSVTTAAALCRGERASRFVTADVRAQVLRDYGMEHVPGDLYELDALITPELGGSVDARNLWPQRYGSPVWNARVKDELERLLPGLVCSGKVDLSTAQRDIAGDWIAAYQKYFRTSAPLRAHRGPDGRDEPEIVTLPRLAAGGTRVPLVPVALLAAR